MRKLKHIFMIVFLFVAMAVTFLPMPVSAGDELPNDPPIGGIGEPCAPCH